MCLIATIPYVPKFVLSRAKCEWSAPRPRPRPRSIPNWIRSGCATARVLLWRAMKLPRSISRAEECDFPLPSRCLASRHRIVAPRAKLA